MAIIIDADVVVKGERGNFDLRGWLAGQAEDMEMAAITMAELWHGVERATSPHRIGRERYIRTIFEKVSIIPYTEEIALTHARIWAELEHAGKMSGPYDLIVAATALERGSAVATFNYRHFENVRGLRLIVPAMR